MTSSFVRAAARSAGRSAALELVRVCLSNSLGVLAVQAGRELLQLVDACSSPSSSGSRRTELVADVEVVLHHVQREVVVLLQREDHVVALVAQHVVEVGDLDQLLLRDLSRSGIGQVRRWRSPRRAALRDARRSGRSTASTGHCPVVSVVTIGHVDVVEPEEALVRRLVAPDRLHVVEDVLLDVHAQPVDLGDPVVVLLDGGRRACRPPPAARSPRPPAATSSRAFSRSARSSGLLARSRPSPRAASTAPVSASAGDADAGRRCA